MITETKQEPTNYKKVLNPYMHNMP